MIFDTNIERICNRLPPFKITPALTHLEDVRHTYRDEFYALEPGYMTRWLTLPSIRRLFVHSVSCHYYKVNDTSAMIEADSHLVSMTPYTSSVEHIELRSCALGHEDLVALLWAPKALRTFIYEIALFPEMIETVGHSFIALNDALSQQKEVLQELWLDVATEKVL